MRAIAYNRPTDIWIENSVNDYGGANYASINAFSNVVNNAVVLMHQVAPASTIWLQTPISKFVETANGAGWTLPQVRTMFTTIAGLHTYCQVVDGTLLCTTNLLNADGLHPNEQGNFRMASYITTNLMQAPVPNF